MLIRSLWTRCTVRYLPCWLVLAGGCTFNLNGVPIVGEERPEPDAATPSEDGGSPEDAGSLTCQNRDLLLEPPAYAPDQACDALREGHYCIVLYAEPGQVSPRHVLRYVGLDTGSSCAGPATGPLLGAGGSMGRIGDELFVCAGRPGPLLGIAMADGSVNVHDYGCFGATDFRDDLVTAIAVQGGYGARSPSVLAKITDVEAPRPLQVAWDTALDQLASDGNWLATSDGSSSVWFSTFPTPAPDGAKRVTCGAQGQTYVAMDLLTNGELVRVDSAGKLDVFDAATCQSLRSFPLATAGNLPVAVTCLAGTPEGVIEPWEHQPVSSRQTRSVEGPASKDGAFALSSQCSGTLSRYQATASPSEELFVVSAEHQAATVVEVRDTRRTPHVLVLADGQRWRLEVHPKSGLERVILSNDRTVELSVVGREDLIQDRFLGDKALARTPALAYASGGAQQLLAELRGRFGLELTEFAGCAPDASGSLADPSFAITNRLPTCP